MENEKIPRRFEFARDRFAFANELLWHYQRDAASGRMLFRPREPKPEYAHRCFVLVRAARQFLYHARWDAGARVLGEEDYRRQVRSIVSRSPLKPSGPEGRVLIPGYANLYEFSGARETLLKSECGGAWRSYVLRSHWRMIFPISRRHQMETARGLAAALEKNVCPIIHLVTFPALTINHGMILYGAREDGAGIEFTAYDPNDPVSPATLRFERGRRTFSLRANRYWAGGDLNVIQIYQSWMM